MPPGVTDAHTSSSGYTQSQPMEEGGNGFGSQGGPASLMQARNSGKPSNMPDSRPIAGLVRHVETLAATGAGAPRNTFQVAPDVPPGLVPLLGMKRGIQGHYNSCYMDATLFGMFVLSDLFDRLLIMELRPDVGARAKPPEQATVPKSKRVPSFEERRDIQKLLREGIVNPLRRYESYSFKLLYRNLVTILLLSLCILYTRSPYIRDYKGNKTRHAQCIKKISLNECERTHK